MKITKVAMIILTGLFLVPLLAFLWDLGRNLYNYVNASDVAHHYKSPKIPQIDKPPSRPPPDPANPPNIDPSSDEEEENLSDEPLGSFALNNSYIEPKDDIPNEELLSPLPPESWGDWASKTAFNTKQGATATLFKITEAAKGFFTKTVKFLEENIE